MLWIARNTEILLSSWQERIWKDSLWFNLDAGFFAITDNTRVIRVSISTINKCGTYNSPITRCPSLRLATYNSAFPQVKKANEGVHVWKLQYVFLCTLLRMSRKRLWNRMKMVLPSHQSCPERHSSSLPLLPLPTRFFSPVPDCSDSPEGNHWFEYGAGKNHQKQCIAEATGWKCPNPSRKPISWPISRDDSAADIIGCRLPGFSTSDFVATASCCNISDSKVCNRVPKRIDAESTRSPRDTNLLGHWVPCMRQVKKRDWTSEVLSKFSRGQTVKMRVYFPVESVYILTKQGTPSNSGTSSQATSIHRCRNTLLIPSAFWHTVAFMLLSDICLNDQPSSPHLQLASIPCTLAPSMVQFFLERFCPATRTLSKLSSGAFVILGANDAGVYLCHEVLTDQGALWKWLKMSGWNTASELLQQRYASLGVQIALAIKELAAFLPFRYCLEREREIHLDLFVQIHLQWGGSQLGRSPKSELLTSNWGSNNHTRQCQKWPCSSRRVSWVHKVFQWLSAVLWFLWRLAINWQNGTN